MSTILLTGRNSLPQIMNSEDQTIHDRYPSLPYANRFVQGRVISQDQGVLHFRLESSVDVTPSPQWARVRKENMPFDAQVVDYSLHSLQRIFLLRPTTKAPHLWYASLSWADNKSNPWSDDSPCHPRLGKEVSGTVTGFAGETFAIVTLDDSRIEAFLHWEEVPAGRRPIASVLHVGDRILALISEVKSDRLMVHLSAKKAIEKSERHYRNLQKKIEPQGNDTVVFPKPYPLEEQPFNKLQILIVEHDHTFANNLLDLLKGLGANAVWADNSQYVTQLLRGNDSFSHILCDYRMGSLAQRQELHSLVSRFKTPVALMSGEYVDAQLSAQERGWVFLPKPIAYADLYGWLVEGKVLPVSIQEETALSQAWGLGLEGKAYLKRAESAIKDFCGRTSTIGAFWVRRQREGVYAILAACNLDNQRLNQAEENFGQSLVHNVIEAAKPLGFSAQRSGPLWKTAPPRTSAIIGLPLCWSQDMLPDALIVYVHFDSEQQIEDLIKSWQADLDDLAKRLGDLDEMAMLAERLREAEAFATMGRVTGAILHEIRQALQPFETYVALARLRLQQQAPPAETLDAVSHLAKATQRISALAKTNLYNLQKTRQQIVQINQRIKEIVDWYAPRAQRHDLLLKTELLEIPITLTLPPEALEQPLANLLDNAFHHFGERKWGTITVRLHFDINKPLHPVSIDVQDQGQGMTVEQRHSLFTPRVSTRGNQGYGLGLYTSRQLLRAVGGDLECVESWRWLGSTFRILLPYKIDKN